MPPCALFSRNAGLHWEKTQPSWSWKKPVAIAGKLLIVPVSEVLNQKQLSKNSWAKKSDE
jgi:hypothetical protein